MSITNSRWAMKYRPTKKEDFVGNPDFLNKIDHWVEINDIPHLLLVSENSGIGKTTVAWLIAKLLDAEVMYINASDENNIETVREKIKTFVSTIGFKTWKIVICDEFSFFTQNAQSALNSIMENYSKTARFIITANYVEKILPSIQSRCTKFELENPPKKGILTRVKYILDTEKIEYDDNDVKKVIVEFYPDQRSILNYIQDNSYTGKFILSQQNIILNDYCQKIVDLFNSKKSGTDIFKEIRQIISDARVKQFSDLYKYLYNNLDEYAGDGKKGLVIMSLAEYQYKDGFVVDKEINVMACIVNILNIIKG